MAVTQNTYTGNGSTVLFSFTFPYLETTDIKVSVNGTITTAYTLANATTIQFNTAPANGAAIRIYRVTDDAALAAQFYPGSAIRSQDLNDNFTQNLYVTQESNRDATSAIATSNSATTTANTALSTANAATATANTASSNASAAVATANTASTNASAAVSTANTASSNATTAVNTANAASATATSAASAAATALSTANTALSTANTASTNATSAVNTANAASSTAASAVSTANTASANASNAVTTANTASSNASAAVTTANTANAKADSAITAISSSAVFTPVANVAAIPGSPTNGQNIQVTDSTGIESFTPLAGLPVGFVGDSGIAARIQYSSGTWNWFGYFATNSDARYLKQTGGTLTGQLKADDSTSTAAPVYSFDGDTDTGIAHTGANELALVTGGTPRLTFDSSGNATFANSVTIPAGSTVTGYLDTTTAASTYLTQSNAASTYQTQAGMSSYLTTANAASTYLTQSNAASTYQTQAGMSSYVPTSGIGSTVQAYDADLAAVAALSTTGLINRTGAGTASTVTAPSGTIVGTSDTQTLTNKTLTDPAIIGTILEDIYTISDGAAFEIDPGNGSIQLITLGANRTPKATNFAAGESVTLMVDDGSAYTLTWSDSTFGGSGVVWKTGGGNAPTLNTTGYTVIVLWKVGTQVYGARVGDA